MDIESRKKHIKKQNIISAVIIVAGTILSLIVFGPQKSKSQDDNSAAQNEPQTKVASVGVVELGSDDSKTAQLEKTATLNPGGNLADVVVQYNGRIQSVSFEIGDYVTEGQTLAVFDQSNLDNSPKVALDSAQNSYQIAQDNLEKTKDVADESLELAKSAVKVAELQYKQAKESGDENAKKLAKENLEIAEDQKDQAEESTELQINSSKLQLEQANTALEQAKIGYEKTFLKAPISGVVISKSVNKDDFANPGQVAAQIVKKGRLEASVFLNSDEVSRVKIGDKVTIIVDGENFGGEISSSSPIANESNQRFEVKVRTSEELANQANKTAAIILDLGLNDENGKFFIPLDSVTIGQQKSEVFVVVDGKVQPRQVKLGKIIGTQVEVLDGLSEGDALVVENGRNLQAGQEVKVQ